MFISENILNGADAVEQQQEDHFPKSSSVTRAYLYSEHKFLCELGNTESLHVD